MRRRQNRANFVLNRCLTETFIDRVAAAQEGIPYKRKNRNRKPNINNIKNGKDKFNFTAFSFSKTIEEISPFFKINKSMSSFLNRKNERRVLLKDWFRLPSSMIIHENKKIGDNPDRMKFFPKRKKNLTNSMRSRRSSRVEIKYNNDNSDNSDNSEIKDNTDNAEIKDNNENADIKDDSDNSYRNDCKAYNLYNSTILVKINTFIPLSEKSEDKGKYDQYNISIEIDENYTIDDMINKSIVKFNETFEKKKINYRLNFNNSQKNSNKDVLIKEYFYSIESSQNNKGKEVLNDYSNHESKVFSLFPDCEEFNLIFNKNALIYLEKRKKCKCRDFCIIM